LHLRTYYCVYNVYIMIVYLILGVIGLAWYVLWLYVINGNYSFQSLNSDFILFGGLNNSRYSFGSYGETLTRSIVSDIPWKSIWTSKPFLAIVVLYVCEPYNSDYYSYSVCVFFNTSTSHIVFFCFNEISVL